MVMVVLFEFSVMRCQPLRRALVSLRKNHQKFTHRVLKIQPLSFKLYILAFGFWLLAFGFFLMPIW
nr:acetyltransferase [Vibrio cholerae]